MTKYQTTSLVFEQLTLVGCQTFRIWTVIWILITKQPNSNWAIAINQSKLVASGLNGYTTVQILNKLSSGFRHSSDFGRSAFGHSLYTVQLNCIVYVQGLQKNRAVNNFNIQMVLLSFESWTSQWYLPVREVRAQVLTILNNQLSKLSLYCERQLSMQYSNENYITMSIFTMCQFFLELT